MKNLQKVTSELQVFLDDFLKNRSELTILEAGCGSMSRVRFKQKCYVTGIDISEKQLQRNTILDQRILGDIQSYDFQLERFDVIICWNVLEHLESPDLALENFSKVIKEDGIIILALPNPLSLKGLITKYTPHQFHVWFYRFVKGYKDAGTEDKPPFRTYLNFCITANSINKFSLAHGLSVVYFDEYDITAKSMFVGKTAISRFTHPIYPAVNSLARFASFGKIGKGELLIVLQN